MANKFSHSRFAVDCVHIDLWIDNREKGFDLVKAGKEAHHCKRAGIV